MRRTSRSLANPGRGYRGDLLMAPTRTAPPLRIGPPRIGPLRIGIVTDGLQERIVDGEVRIANGGVGVYIYQLIRHLLLIDPVNQYFLIRFGRGMLDVYRHGRVSGVFLHPSKANRTLGLFDVPYQGLVRKLKLDLMHYPNQFGGAFLPRSVKRVATLHDLTPLLFPRLHPHRQGPWIPAFGPVFAAPLRTGYRLFRQHAPRPARTEDGRARSYR